MIPFKVPSVNGLRFQLILYIWSPAGTSASTEHATSTCQPFDCKYFIVGIWNLFTLWQHWPLIKLLSYFQYYVSINYIKKLQEAVLLHNASWQTLLKEKNMYAKPRRNYLPANLSLSFATEPIWLGLHIFCKKIINRRTYSDAHFIKKNATCEKTNHHRHHQESSWYGSILSMDPA